LKFSDFSCIGLNPEDLAKCIEAMILAGTP
jgi:hypothetical protein